MNGDDGSCQNGRVELDPTVDFIAGTMAGMTSLVVGYPFDTVKVRFQSPQVAQKYHSTIHAISTIVREERIQGLFKGVASPLTTAALLNGIVFASYRLFMKVQLDQKDATPTLTQIGLAGAGSGIVSSVITTPTELVKIRQQASLAPTSTWQTAVHIMKESGIRGLYRGITATSLRDIGYGAYFAAYEGTCRLLAPSPLYGDSSGTTRLDVQSEALSWPSLLIAGGVAGIAGWVVTFPLDVVKTRMQGVNGGPRMAISSSFTQRPFATIQVESTNGLVSCDHDRYRSTLSTIINSYRTEGVGVFYRGLAPTLIRAIPVNMVTFATFEAVIHGLT